MPRSVATARERNAGWPLRGQRAGASPAPTSGGPAARTSGGAVRTSGGAARTSPGATSAYLVLVLTFLLWSNSFLAARLLVGEEVPLDQRLGPLAFVVARFLPALLVTAPWLLMTRERRAESMRLLRGHGGT